MRSAVGKRVSLDFILLRMTAMQNSHKMMVVFMENISRDSGSLQYYK